MLAQGGSKTIWESTFNFVRTLDFRSQNTTFFLFHWLQSKNSPMVFLSSHFLGWWSEAVGRDGVDARGTDINL